MTEVRQIFDSLGIPYNSNAKDEDYDLNCCKSAESGDYLVEWLSTKLNVQDYAEYIRLCVIDERFKTAERFIGLYQNSPKYPFIRQVIRDIENASSDFSTNSMQLTPTPQVYIGTVHSVKGLEFDDVYVMNVGAKSFRLISEEMRNLFYVATTRAKNRLTVFKVTR